MSRDTRREAAKVGIVRDATRTQQNLAQMTHGDLAKAPMRDESLPRWLAGSMFILL